ncbi:transposase [Patescibacteria group bacterium]|nr:transposase [Patescibacteria group bacterium]
MMRYNNLKQSPKHFLAFTGLTVPEFDKLVKDNRQDWQEQRIQRLLKNNPNRKRKIGGGRKFALESFEDQLLLTLILAKSYCSCLLLEYLFSIDASTVCRTTQVIMAFIKKDGKYIIPINLRQGKKITTLEELRKVMPDIDEILADCTEQKIPRPQKKARRNKHHSGKKKAFTIKTQLATTRQGLIVNIGKPIPGRQHDYKLFKASNLPKIIPKNATVYMDSGYQGVQKDFPDLNAVIPHKRTRNGNPLTRSQKIQNKKQRKIRVVIEHTLSQLKKFQILHQIYRNSLQNYEIAFGFVANIVNFRMLCRLNTA